MATECSPHEMLLEPVASMTQQRRWETLLQWQHPLPAGMASSCFAWTPSGPTPPWRLVFGPVCCFCVMDIRDRPREVAIQLCSLISAEYKRLCTSKCTARAAHSHKYREVIHATECFTKKQCVPVWQLAIVRELSYGVARMRSH